MGSLAGKALRALGCQRGQAGTDRAPRQAQVRSADVTRDLLWAFLKPELCGSPWSYPRGHTEGSQQHGERQIPGAEGRMGTEDCPQRRCIRLDRGGCGRESPERVSHGTMDPPEAESPSEFCIGLVLLWDSFCFKHSNQQKLLGPGRGWGCSWGQLVNLHLNNHISLMCLHIEHPMGSFYLIVSLVPTRPRP